MPTIGERLRRARESKNLKQTQVMKKTGINNKTLSGYENGVSEPDIDSIKLLAELYEVSVDWLVGGTEDKKGFTPLLDEDETTAILKEIAEKYDIDVTDPVKKRKLEEVIKLVFDYRMDGNEL